MRQFSAKQNQPAKANPAPLASSRSVTPERTRTPEHDPCQTAASRPAFDFGRIAVRRKTRVGIQSKLTIGTSGDAFEQEADRVADHVMRMRQPPVRSQAQPGLSEHRIVPAAQVQTKSLDAGGSVGIAAPPIVHDVLQSPGQPLDAATRASMEPRFGHDFSKVRVHADARASASVRAVDALAYTVGSHIAFRSDKYRPAAPEGQRLLAHELAHVLQQSSGGGSAADPEASSAQRAMSSRPVMVGSAPPGLYRQLDETIPADEENEDPWKKALRSSQRSVFGGSAQNPLLPANSSPLFAPHKKLFFPGRFNLDQSQSTVEGKSKPPPSYALKNPLSESPLSKRPINQVGWRPDQPTSHSVEVGVGHMVSVDDQLKEQLDDARKKVLEHEVPALDDQLNEPKDAWQKALAGKDEVRPLEPVKTGAGIELKVLGDYNLEAKEGEGKSFKFDETKLSAGVELKVALRLLKRLRKRKAPHDAYDDGSAQGNAATQGASRTRDREDVKKQHEESPTGTGTEGDQENQKDEESENPELNADEQVGEGLDTKSAITMPLRPKMRTGLERQFDQLARSTAPSVFAPQKKPLFPDRFSPGQSPSTIGGSSQPPKSYVLKDQLSESWLSKLPINQVGLRRDQLSVSSGHKWPIGIGLGGMPDVDDQRRKEFKNAHEKTRISKDLAPVFHPIETGPDLKVKLIGGYDNADKSPKFDMTKVSAGLQLDMALRLLQGSRKPKLHDAYDDSSTQVDATTQGAIGTEEAVNKQDEKSSTGAGTGSDRKNQKDEEGGNLKRRLRQLLRKLFRKKRDTPRF